MTLRLIIGIDPGLRGAIALMADGKPSTLRDMPIRPGSTGRDEVDPFALSKFISEVACAYVGSHVHAVIEATSMRPENARGSDGKAAEGAGIVKGVLASHGISYTVVQPQTWKRYQGLLKRTKEDSRAVAMMKWPTFGVWFQRVMDHDRAEAMLMAEWGNSVECWVPKIEKPKRPKAKSARKLNTAQAVML